MVVDGRKSVKDLPDDMGHEKPYRNQDDQKAFPSCQDRWIGKDGKKNDQDAMVFAVEQ